ncbi:MAG TPA: FAD-dependent oxidoreductase [Thermoanaerobaculia bacterium]|jgi:NADH dehydrogenase FAD-containing subunit|nr:FAD-dependent oxidoreductase [Thermoanaerobaculia bacterium]
MKDQTQHKILILGGGYAGLMAAARVARSGADVTLIDARPSFFQRIRFHEMLVGRTPKTLDYAPALARRGVRFVQARAEILEPGRQRVVARSTDGASIELGYDTLIVALGSTTAPSVPGAAEHAIRLDDPAAIREAAARVRILAASGGRVLVAGGGLTGIETATELAERYPDLHVTLATRGRLGDGYSEAGSDHLRRRLTNIGVSLLDGPGIASLEAGRALREDGSAIDFDLCVWAGGFEAPALAREAGLQVDRCGRILVDPALRALGHPDILAAGDAAVATFADSRAIRMGCVSAMPLGAHAGENVRRILRGEEPRPFDFGFQIRCVSLGRKDGLVQFVEPDDTPRPKVWTRRPAVLIKELICRMTYGMVRNELRAGLPLYRWPGSGRVAMVQSPTKRAEARSQG